MADRRTSINGQQPYASTSRNVMPSMPPTEDAPSSAKGKEREREREMSINDDDNSPHQDDKKGGGSGINRVNREDQPRRPGLIRVRRDLTTFPF